MVGRKTHTQTKFSSTLKYRNTVKQHLPKCALQVTSKLYYIHTSITDVVIGRYIEHSCCDNQKCVSIIGHILW